MVPLFASWVFAWAVRGDAKITYENAGANLARELADISSLSGVKLLAAPETAKEILILRSDGQPLQKVMDQIAWAVDAEWHQTSVGFRLERPSSRLANEHDHALKAQTRLMAKGVEIYLKGHPSAKPFDFDAAEELVGKLQSIQKENKESYYPKTRWQDAADREAASPGARAIREIIGHFDPSELARIRENSGGIYSSRPNGHQEPLDSAFEDIVATFIEQQRMLAKAMERHGDHEGTLDGKSLSSRLTPSNVDHVVLYAHQNRLSTWPRLSISFCVLDHGGHVLAGAGDVLAAWGTTPASIRLAPDTKPIAFNSIHGAFDVSAASSGQRLSASEIDTLTHPEVHDPMSLWTGPIFLAIARSQHLCLAANLADALIRPPYKKEILPAEFLGEVEDFEYERTQTDTWLTIRPTDLPKVRNERTDRAALGAYLRAYAGPGELSIDEHDG